MAFFGLLHYHILIDDLCSRGVSVESENGCVAAAQGALPGGTKPVPTALLLPGGESH
jgi:hypothetical protein